MDSLFSLAGKKAVITGCATGIGKGMAAGLARAGADIIALDIGDLEDTRRTVENLGRECRCYHVDLSVSSDVDEVWIRFWKKPVMWISCAIMQVCSFGRMHLNIRKRC